MLYWAIVSLALAVVAAFLSLFGIPGAAMQLARLLLIIFLVVFVSAALSGTWRHRPR